MTDDWHNPLHSMEIRQFFPEIVESGVDLWGVIEIKQTINHHWKVKQKDLDAKLILFYGSGEWFFVPIRDIKQRYGKDVTERSFTLNFVTQHSIFETCDGTEAHEYATKLRKKYQPALDGN